MDSGNIPASDFDVAIVGGSAAGLAAAITCAKAGLSAVAIESSGAPRHRPGEALHPGVEAVFQQLGILGAIEALGPVRFSGIHVISQQGSVFSPFGSDAAGAWQGFQVGRADLDGILRTQAVNTGCTLLQPARVTHLERSLAGWLLTTTKGSIRARSLIDGTGPARWLARRLALPVVRLSPTLSAKYAYIAVSQVGSNPFFTECAAGWTWTSLVKPGVQQWVGVSLQEGANLPTPQGAEVKASDVTWRAVPACAGPGYFIVGDAAAVLDPACSHGVLRALMSGIYAATLAASAHREAVSAADSAAAYRGWLLEWVCRDVLELICKYARLPSPPEWLQTAAATCSDIWTGLPPARVTIPS